MIARFCHFILNCDNIKRLNFCYTKKDTPIKKIPVSEEFARKTSRKFTGILILNV